MRDRNLTGPWAGFSFKGGRLVTPEGRELYPEDLAWLSLTAAQAQEWRRMMGELRRTPAVSRGSRKPCAARATESQLAYGRAEVVIISTLMANRRKLSAVVTAGPDAEPPVAVLPVPGPKRRQRV
ncbi:Phage protein [compost metagenome]